MRKTSQDGGDTSSITSGIENEVKKSATGIVKIKRNSIKKKVQSFSHESDDGVVEPLLQKDKAKSEFPSQSAKYLLSKTKTDSVKEKGDDRDMLLPENANEKSPFISVAGNTDNLINGTKGPYKAYSCTTNATHNHMNINVFSSPDVIKPSAVPKTQVLVEIDGNKQSSFHTGPLIFTTAKIHTDGKPMQMEPVQVTPVPILSTVEGTVIKTSSINENERKNIGGLNKSNNIISSVEFSKLGPGVPSHSHAGSMLSDASKMKADERNVQSLSNKMNIPSSVNDPCMSKPFTSELKSNEVKITSLSTSKDTVPNVSLKSNTSISTMVPQTLKGIPKAQSSGGRNIITSQEMDVNKNFQTGVCRDNINLCAKEAILTKDKISNQDVPTTIPNKAPILVDKFAIPTLVPTPSQSTTSITSISNIKPTLASPLSVTKNNTSTIISPATNSNLTKAISTQVSTKVDPVKVITVSTTHTTGSVKSSSIITAPKVTNSMLLNKQVSKPQEQTTKQAEDSAASTGPTTSLISSVKPSSSTISNISTAGKPLITTGKSKSSAISSMITPTSVKYPDAKTSCILTTSGNTLISDSKPVCTTVSSVTTASNISIKTQIPKTSNSVPLGKVLTSARKPVLAASPALSTTAGSQIKSPVSTKSVVASAEIPLSTRTPTSVPALPISTTISVVFPSSITSPSLTTSVKLSTSTAKPVSTIASSASSIKTTSGKPDTTPISTKNISSIAQNAKLSSSVTSTSATISSKSTKAKDAVPTNNRVASSTSSVVPIVATVQVPSAAVSKTLSTSSAQTPATSVKSVKPENSGTKTSSGGPKQTQAPPSAKAGSSQTKAISKQSTTPTTVSTSSQVSKTSVTNKPNELQNNEHKKEKLK